MAAYERGASQTQLDFRFAEQVASQAEQALQELNELQGGKQVSRTLFILSTAQQCAQAFV